ncbi:hypothetical protein LA080_011789 [Diaporthe eres]|nr:hypothetical protein LA080_011789 [Diaporthe eres]
MSNSNISPEGVVNLLNPFKGSRSTEDTGMRDEASTSNVGRSRAAEKASSSNVQINVSSRTFHRFGDLPPEIRCTIWAMALPTRIVSAYSTKPASRFSCSSRQSCKKLMMPLSTWLLEGSLPDQLQASWSRAQREEYMEKVLYKEEMVPIITWFNAKTDFIQIEPIPLRRFSELPGPPNHDDVFQAALDPETNLLLFSYYFDEWEDPAYAFVFLRNGLRALYHRYLRTRKHIYIVVGGMQPYVLTDEGWQKAIHEGLFSGHYEETRLVPLDDEVLIRKANLPDAQVFMLQIADFLMCDIGLGYGRGEETMELDGHLKQDHPLVQQLDLRLPDFNPVLLFEARKAPSA